ncbi:hypothetical protein GGX14DRAFT_570312 [Mycena pura]|uniref:Uncharacterized protein n=1 Tax=Mycena pura TaxID=153505 RepID=A0AAD6V995_9AGAR|nr:hypothetical protein GGX14DRAFT_570312 [Mycena pura]
MKFSIALLVSFVAVAAANPIVDAAARGSFQCEIFGFSCSGGDAQVDYCEQLEFQCTGTGKHPIIANSTIAGESS